MYTFWGTTLLKKNKKNKKENCITQVVSTEKIVTNSRGRHF